MPGPDELRDTTLRGLAMMYRLVHLEWATADAHQLELARKRRGEPASRASLAADERLGAAVRALVALEREILVRVRMGAEQL